MVSEVSQGVSSPSSTTSQRKGRGPAKTFPLTPFEDVLVLPKAIHEHGVDGVLRRVTVFDRIRRSPESSSSRQMVTDAARYGLTTGSYQAEQLRLDDAGKRLHQHGVTLQERRQLEFEVAVSKFEAFNAAYERLKDKRLPAPDVLTEQLTSIPQADRSKCAEVFVKNLRYLGLVKEIAGSERVISIEQALEELPSRGGGLTAAGVPPPSDVRSSEPESPEETSKETRTPRLLEPSVHIDVNIHISSDASSDQIDQIFASMARHLYGRSGD